jgi:GTP cyclohydrolase III
MTDQVNPESEVVNIVSAISDNKRAEAIDAIQDLLYAKASDAMTAYKQVVAKTYFDEPVGETPNETDNRTD